MRPDVAAVILAAGQSRRMGSDNKLLMPFRGKPLLRHVVDAVHSSQLARFAVVTGHQADTVRSVLPKGTPTIHNYEHEGGMAGSIRAGIYRLQGRFPVMVLLGDMPLITSAMVDRMVTALGEEDPCSSIIAASQDGQLGNPVLFGTDYFAPLKMLDGDQGARALIRENDHHVTRLELGSAARLDLDTPQAFQAAESR